MYSEQIDGGEIKIGGRHTAERFHNYSAKLEENREALDAEFDKYVQNQKLASIGAALELNKLAAKKAPGSPSCADNCSCLYCQRTAELRAIYERGLTASTQAAAIEQQQKVASANSSNNNNNNNSASVHRQPKWKMISGSLR